MDTELINYESALDRLGGDTEFLHELLGEMLGQIESDMEMLKEAIGSSDYKSVQRIAHGLKGASANLDITKLFHLFKELEERAEQESIDGAETLINEIQAGTDELRTFISNL